MAKQPNLILIGLDSLRRDHMSLYGYDRLTTPHIDRYAAAGATFEQCFSPSVPTTPGYGSMLTGMDCFSTDVVALRHKGEMGDHLTTLPEFLAGQGVTLVASMPCYLEENVDAQRGAGAYGKSVEAIRRLNRLGYGREEGLTLDFVYNPAGPTLAPDQSGLEADYKRDLGRRFGIVFNRLLTITNMPIGRFRDTLRRQHGETQYMKLLCDAFNPATTGALMCRHQISVGWDGTLYDCDFNLALRLPVNHGATDRLEEFDKTALARRRIVTGEHCFGCTAGWGSSCGGALA